MGLPFTLLLTLVFGAVVWAASPRWQVPESLTVNQDRISLADLLPDVPRDVLPAQLAETFIAQSPEPGRSRSLPGALLRKQFAAAGVPQVVVPAHVTVERPGWPVDLEMGRQAVVEYIRERAPWPADRYRIDFLREPTPVMINAGPVTVRVLQGPKKQLAGTHSYVVEYRQEGRREVRGSFNVRVHVEAAIQVAARAMPRGTVLAETDLVSKQVDLASIRGVPETDPAKIVGARLAHPLQEGQLITVDSCEPIPIVRRGDAVVLVARREGLVVSAFGVAREDGAVGEMISIENVSSKQLVHGRVENANTVAVSF